MTRPEKLGAAGRLARAFIHSKLTPLLLVGSALLGAFAVWRLPREEEPQIVVPMSDVFVRMPGASAKEVESRVTKPLERLLWEVQASNISTRPRAPEWPPSSCASRSARTRSAARSGSKRSSARTSTCSLRAPRHPS